MVTDGTRSTVDSPGAGGAGHGGSPVGTLPAGVEKAAPTAPDIEAEAEAIASSTVVAPGPPLGRCAWCGRLSHDLTFIESVHGLERRKCHVCVGAIYG